MSKIELVGYIAAGLVIATLSMRTMIPLRMVGICSNIAFVSYGFLIGSLPTMMLHCILFPLNVYRLVEMRTLIKKTEEVAAAGDMSMNWIKPFMSKRPVASGEILFRKGDDADHMYFVVSGRLYLHELGIEILPGAVVGELGMLAPGRKRTQTLESKEDGLLLEIDYQKIEHLYYQNPKFGFYFLKLSTARLFDNIRKLEGALAEREAEVEKLRSAA
jgi:hypothetical protein